MKKLVAISVLFAGLATAVFAQSGGWSNEWKLGFNASYITDMFYAASASSKSEATRTTTPDAVALDGTVSKEFGKYSKGVTHFFPNDALAFGFDTQDVFVRLENSGENYAIRMVFGLGARSYNTEGRWTQGVKFIDIISGGTTPDDWGVKANVGIFNLGIGPWATEAAWVDTNATWGSQTWLPGWASYNRFGVWRTPDSPVQKYTNGFVHSNHFRTLDQWGNPFAVGMKLGDQFKFTLGYSIKPFDEIWGPTVGKPETDNRSSMNGTFMFSGSPVDALAFDLFYSIVGGDTNTLSNSSLAPTGSGDTYNPNNLPGSTSFGYKDPTGKWTNVVGAYVQIKAIENLSISLGYTVDFIVYEAGSFMCSDGDYTQAKSVKYNAPIFSGIDLRLGFNGIDKIGLKFNNNISFAGVKGDKVAKDPTNALTPGNHDFVYKDTINLLFNEKFDDARKYGDGLTQDWFHWTSRLEVAMSFIDGVPLQLSLGNRLGVITNKLDKSAVTSAPAAAVTETTKTEGTRTETSNIFEAGVGARYGMGGVTLGLGLVLRVTSDLVEDERTVTTTLSSGGTPGVFKRTYKSNENVVEFGIPITFSLSF